MCHLIKGLTSVRERFYQDVADGTAAVQEGNILDVGTGRGLLPIKIAQKNERLKAYAPLARHDCRTQ